MIKHFRLIAASLAFILSPIYAQSMPMNQLPPLSPPIKQALKVKHFSNIDAEGYFKILLVTDESIKQPEVVKSTSRYNPIRIQVKGNTLMLRSAWLPQPRMKRKPLVIVKTNDIERIALAGPTNLVGRDVHSKRGLHLFSMGSGKIRFTGKPVLLNYIRQVGNADIKIEWSESDVLRADISGGRVELAGVAQQVYARVFSYARLNASYLRAQNVSIQTADRAIARVSATDDLRAFASGFSNVFYYKQPKHMTRHAIESGNVLQMAWRN